MTLPFDGAIQRKSSGALIIWESFDRPDGTPINGQIAESGSLVFSDASGNSYAVVRGGELTNTGNSYSSLHNNDGSTDIPLIHFGGCFRLMADTVAPAAIIADASDSPPLTEMVHVQISRTGWTAQISAPGYAPFTYIGQNTYAPLVLGEMYHISLDFDYPNNAVTVTGPDGVAKTLTHPAIGTLQPAIGRFQLGAFAQNDSAHWGLIEFGQTKAEAFRALGKGAPMAEISRLNSLQTKIRDSKTLGTSGTTAFATFKSAGPQSCNSLRVKANSVVISAALPGVAMDIREWEVPIVSNGAANVLEAISTLYSNPQNTSGVTVSVALSASISSGLTTLKATPSVGGANASYVTGVRLNYVVEAFGDADGVLDKL